MQLGVSDAAQLLGSTEAQIYAWVQEGAIPHDEVNEQLRFNRTELLEWATARGIPLAPELFGAAETPLARALEVGGIHHDVPAPDRERAIRTVVERLPIDDAGERAVLTDVLLACDTPGTTIGDGIAIPHARRPIVLPGARSAIALAFLDRPLDLHAIDGRPVTTLFTLLSPNPKAHLHLLSRLSAALHDPDFRAAVLRRAPAAELLREARRADGAAARAREESKTR